MVSVHKKEKEMNRNIERHATPMISELKGLSFTET